MNQTTSSGSESRQQTTSGRAVRRIVGLPTLILGFVAAAMPDGHGLRLRHLSEALAAEEKEIIAAQVRKRGFACDKPASAERELQRSKPNETVWILKCGNASYRVRLVPKMAATVDRID